MYPVKEAIAKDAHIQGMEAYSALYKRSIEDPEGFWKEQGERLTWFHPPARTMRVDNHEVDFAWYEGGRLNASYNCIDRHLEERGNKTAIIWAADDVGTYRHITYRELSREVGRMANVLKAHGVRKGDRVCIYLPMIPELAYAMLACARLGAIHSVVFAGFSADALRDRIEDAACTMLITANEGLRGGRTIPLKATCDEACLDGSPIETMLVVRRTDAETPMQAGRDLWYHDERAKQRATCPPEWMASEDPLFILYTSGSTGKPKGVAHSTAGYMVYTSLTHQYVFDIHEDDVYFCAADCGWITGHSYIVYGPLANGATTVMFESTPLFPDAGRYWRVIDDLNVSVFYTAPTALRACARAGNDFVTQYKREKLRVLGTVGEPINPEIWEWYHDVVGDKRCTIVDTWWQTETGGILITPLPGVTACKPGSATLPFFGVKPVLMDDNGAPLKGNDVRGNLCLAQPWPGQARTIYGDHGRFRKTYFARFPGYYFTGDGCHRDADGYYWITGRVDDVLNVSGHRLGTAEIESALVAHDAVAEAAVVGIPHEIKGQGIYVFAQVNTSHEGMDKADLVQSLRDQVRKAIGPIATPEAIQISPGLPKTRSGKIMRRILRKIAVADYDSLGDVSTLADPSVVAKLVEDHRAAT